MYRGRDIKNAAPGIGCETAIREAGVVPTYGLVLPTVVKYASSPLVPEASDQR